MDPLFLFRKYTKATKRAATPSRSMVPPTNALPAVRNGTLAPRSFADFSLAKTVPSRAPRVTSGLRPAARTTLGCANRKDRKGTAWMSEGVFSKSRHDSVGAPFTTGDEVTLKMLKNKNAEV